MRKHNIGRISIIVIVLNVIFLLVYMSEKNNPNPQMTQTQQEEIVQTSMVIYSDETVDGAYTTSFENIVTDKKYSDEEIRILQSYEFYLTDLIANTDSFIIKDHEVIIYAADDNFATNVNLVLEKILKEDGKEL